MSNNETPSKSAGRAWLASLILNRPRGFMSRLALGLSRLGAMPRGWRRRLRRRAAVTVAGAALILSMAGSAWLAPPVHAATINVTTGDGIIAADGECSLLEAILNANVDDRVFNSPGECAAGSGADTINLTTDVTLETAYAYSYSALPTVTSEIIIEGDGHTIKVPSIYDDSPPVDNFRIFNVDLSGDLELRDVTLTGGVHQLGGSILSNGDLTLREVTIRDAIALYGGGILHVGNGTEMIIEDSTITNNAAYHAGGGIGIFGYEDDNPDVLPTVTISGNSLITGNFAYLAGGGGIVAENAHVMLIDSTISLNVAGEVPFELEPDSVGQALSDGAGLDRFSPWARQGAERAGRAFLMERPVLSGAMDVQPQDAPYPYFGVGGGVYTTDASTFTALDSTISGNRAGIAGGGVANDYSSTVAIYHSTIADNFGSVGGGVANIGNMTLVYSTIDGNRAYYIGGVALLQGDTTISYSTISFNEALGGEDEQGIGGGVGAMCGTLNIRSSTISNNTAEGDGGGVYIAYDYLGSCDDESNEGAGDYGVLLDHTTIIGNTAGNSGGGVARLDGEEPEDRLRPLKIIGSIVSGNKANGVDGVANIFTTSNINLTHGNNLFGADGDSGVDGFTPSVTDIVPPSGLTVADILKTTLANNGGPTKTHLLVAGSPALDKDFNENCELSGGITLTDQRGQPRNQDADGAASGKECDIGAVEGIESFAALPTMFMSAKTSGTTADGVAFDNSDILKWDGSEWTKVFDGSDAQLFPKKSKHNVNSFWVDGDEIIMSFAQNGRRVPGIVPKVEGADLVRWDGSAFSLWFDGSDVGLDKNGPEKINGLHVLDGDLSPIGGSCIHYLLISTHSKGAVPAYGGGQIKFGGEDVLGFCMTNQGAATDGFWHVVLDGSAVGLPRNIIDSISADEDGQTIYFTTSKKINLGGVSGGPSAVFAYDLTTGDISGPIFVPADNGLTQGVDGLDMD